MKWTKNLLGAIYLISFFFYGITLSQAQETFSRFRTNRNLPISYTELIDYTVPSPDQEYSGSCLYMASTGAMEILANLSHQIVHPEVDSEYDLSESYALSGPLPQPAKSWFETPILRFFRGGIRSKDFPYNPTTFWQRGLPERPLVELPQFTTKVLFKASGKSEDARKKLGVMSEEHVLAIKKALVTHRGPVVVIYRDVGYEEDYGLWDTWHAVVIIGYDDQGKEGGSNICLNVERSFSGLGSYEKAKLKKLMDEGGGCRPQGVFYVRESEGAPEGETRVPLYELRSYDWIKYLGNHAFVTYLL